MRNLKAAFVSPQYSNQSPCHADRSALDTQAQREHKPREAFKSYERGYLHTDVSLLPQMADQTQRGYLNGAIARVTRWAFIAINQNMTVGEREVFPQRFSQDKFRDRP